MSVYLLLVIFKAMGPSENDVIVCIIVNGVVFTCKNGIKNLIVRSPTLCFNRSYSIEFGIDQVVLDSNSRL